MHDHVTKLETSKFYAELATRALVLLSVTVVGMPRRLRGV